MTKDDIIRMAREVGGTDMAPYDYGAKPDRLILQYDALTRFAALVAAAEREACISICEHHWRHSGTAQECADAIRARSNK